MSIVGPRPIVRSEADRYGRRFALYQRVPPGITGLWQISGRNRLSYEERRKLDLRFVRDRSVRMYLRILLRTIPEVWSGSNSW